MKNLFKKIAILSIVLIVFGCSKDGAKGDTGANGVDGNANVLGSPTFTTTAANWTSNSGGVYWTASFTGATAITQSIVDNGIVSVFFLTGTEWTPLPFTIFNQNMTYAFGVGTIDLVAQSTDFTAMANPGNVTIRYVVISASNKMAHPKTNWNDYNEVKKVLNLND